MRLIMKNTQIKVLEEVSLDNPIFIEALPGIGHVGKLAADHLIDELNATKFAEIYSPYFPPQVFIGENGINQYYSKLTDDKYGTVMSRHYETMVITGGTFSDNTAEAFLADGYELNETRVRTYLVQNNIIYKAGRYYAPTPYAEDFNLVVVHGEYGTTPPKYTFQFLRYLKTQVDAKNL